METHSYQVSAGWKMFAAMFGVGVTFFAGLFIWAVAYSEPGSMGAMGMAITYGFGFLLATLALLMAAGIISNRLELSEDHIEIYGEINGRRLLARRLERRDIAAKMFVPGAGSGYVLYPWRREQKKLPVSSIFASDDYLRRWIAAIPNADREFLRNRRKGLYDNR